ncbi:MAG: hypothetical protein Kow0059_04560 [Candidatus Sumerlaeia bacterium]
MPDRIHFLFFNVSTDIGVWIAAGLTLAIYSFLYKDNPFYKLAEHIYVGVSTGYVLCTLGIEVIKSDLWFPLTEDFSKNFYLIFPGLLGLMMFTRFSRQYAWLSRYPLAVIIGITVGYAAPNNIQAVILRHGGAVIKPIWQPDGGWADYINALIAVLCVVTILIYFFFSIEHKGPLRPVAYTGILFLMIYFGASFGYMMMARLSLLIGRVNFLLIDWLGVVGGSG